MSLTLPFPPYEKIAESLAACLGDDEAALRASRRVEWVVTEKIHGAHFCLVTDGASVRCAKRKAWLEEDEDFFGHRALVGRLRRAAMGAFRRVAARADGGAVEALFIYGELFGGRYGHADVADVPEVEPVQTGCWYCPGIEFQAFDVGVIREGERERVYLDQDAAASACVEAGIRFARPLFRGGYEEAFVFPLGFETTIPALLGLPPLGPSNKAEGVVLKPATGIVVPRRPGVARPVVKRKIAEFAEDERFHGARKWEPRDAAARAAGALEWLKWEVAALVNENRFFAAVSKVGAIRGGDGGWAEEVGAMIREDLESEIGLRHGAVVVGLSAGEAAELAKCLDGEARALVELYGGR